MGLVSVIIPFFNTPVQFMQEAIESVLAQRYDQWEILLVDDGSTEQSSRIAWHYAQAYPDKVRYLEHDNHQNHGSSASRNLGISHARGEYIAFLDADDVWLPNKLEEQVAILDSRPDVGMLYGNTQYWYSWTGNPKDAKRDYSPRLGVRPGLVRPPKLLPLFLQGKAAVPCTCSVLLRREIVDEIGGFKDSFKGLYDDQALYAKVCLQTPVYVTETCWDRYRRHPESMCAVSQGTSQERLARSMFLEWLGEYLTEQRLLDGDVRRALQMEQWVNRHPFWGRKLKKTQHFVWRLQKLVAMGS